MSTRKARSTSITSGRLATRRTLMHRVEPPRRRKRAARQGPPAMAIPRLRRVRTTHRILKRRPRSLRSSGSPVARRQQRQHLPGRHSSHGWMPKEQAQDWAAPGRTGKGGLGKSHGDTMLLLGLGAITGRGQIRIVRDTNGNKTCKPAAPAAAESTGGLAAKLERRPDFCRPPRPPAGRC